MVIDSSALVAIADADIRVAEFSEIPVEKKYVNLVDRRYGVQLCFADPERNQPRLFLRQLLSLLLLPQAIHSGHDSGRLDLPQPAVPRP